MTLISRYFLYYCLAPILFHKYLNVSEKNILMCQPAYVMDTGYAHLWYSSFKSILSKTAQYLAYHLNGRRCNLFYRIRKFVANNPHWQKIKHKTIPATWIIYSHLLTYLGNIELVFGALRSCHECLACEIKAVHTQKENSHRWWVFILH